jgi:hypothetical protein
MSEYTESDLDIIGDTYDIPPHNWRNCSSWYEGAMIRPLTNDALNYCCANGTYFETPNAYFVEGWEDDDCQDCQVLGTGTAPQLGDRCQHQLTEIWEEMFEKAEEPAAPFKPLENFNESVERAAVGKMAAESMLATFKPRPKMITDEEVRAILDIAETATAEQVKAAYGRLMINAPCWAFSDDVNQQRQFLIESREGPQA